MGNKKTIFRLSFLLVIVVIFFFTRHYHCLKLDFSPIPGVFTQDNHTKTIYVLYGSGLCGSCPPGKRLLSLNERMDVLFIVPGNFTDVDISNLRDTFMLKGAITRGDTGVESFLKMIASCHRLSDWQNNIYIEMGDNNRITKLKKI